MSASPVIVWFRRDLRVADNPALAKAAETGAPVVPLYIHDVQSKGVRAPGAAQNWFLDGALAGLQTKLEKLGVPLAITTGKADDVLDRVIAETDAKTVYWNRRHVPAETEIDRAIKQTLSDRGFEARSFQANLLHEPSRLLTGGGTPFKVYTPFWKALINEFEPRAPLAAPKKLNGFSGKIKSGNLSALGLLPTKPDWAGGLRETWKADEDGAAETLAEFIDGGLSGYAEGRDFPARQNVSRLSPYLRWGVLSPYQLWHAAQHAQVNERDRGKFLQELGWREFCQHHLFHFPDLAEKNYNSRFDDFEWTENSPHLDAWRTGRTGYPIVDAGMRELWRTGYMHNRVRMIVASFLIKHLMVDWRVGEKWFWDTLVDGDPASNPASWQWVAGSGADAAPYFRIFNPVLQGEKFDPKGDYVRQWVPEIAALPDKHLHAPWDTPDKVLEESGITLGMDYPEPVVDHKQVRNRALEAFKRISRDS